MHIIYIYRGSLVVKALGCYKPEDRGFETRWGEILNLILPAALRQGFTQPLTELSTGNIKKIIFLWSKVRPVRGADNVTAIYEPIV
jgi:hypothetical protein